VKKEQVIARLGEVRRKIVAVAASLPPNKQNEIFLGVWSVKDLLAHLVGWDFANLAMAQEILAGKLPGSMPTTTMTGAATTPSW
jgi:hypothetical protein